MRRLASVFGFVLLAVGLAGSLVLLRRLLQLAEDGHADADLCAAWFGQGCDGVLTESADPVLGIPLAGWGVVYFGSLLLLLILARCFDATFRRAAEAAATGLLLAGGVMSVWLLVRLAGDGLSLCPLCLVVNIANLLVLGLHALARPHGLSTDVGAYAAGMAYVAGRPTQDRLGARWRAFGILFVVLTAGVVYQRILLEVRGAAHRAPATDDRSILTAFARSPRVDLALREDEVALGASDAPLDLVVFSDAFCPHCRTFWQRTPGLLERYPGKLRLVFKHLPMEKRCNLGVALTLHPGACESAYAMEAARRQGRFWPFHDALFAAGSRRSSEFLLAVARTAGLDVERFEADLTSPAVRERVDEDIALGRRLMIDGTPTFILDGRLVPLRAAPRLELLLDHLARSTRVPIHGAGGAPGPRGPATRVEGTR